MSTLFDKSGAEGEYRRFKFELLKLSEKNALPGYDLSIEQARDGEPILRRRRNDSKGDGLTLTADEIAETHAAGQGALAAQTEKVSLRKLSAATLGGDHDSDTTTLGAAEKRTATTLIRSTISGLSAAATRGFITDETHDYLSATYPGWDFHTLHAEFEQWAKASPERAPVNWQKAFIGWVKRHHDKYKHELRG